MRHIDFVLVGTGADPRPAAVRRAIQEFEERGVSRHSMACWLGRYIIKHCVERGIAFDLRHHAWGGKTTGWTITRVAD